MYMGTPKNNLGKVVALLDMAHMKKKPKTWNESYLVHVREDIWCTNFPKYDVLMEIGWSPPNVTSLVTHVKLQVQVHED